MFTSLTDVVSSIRLSLTSALASALQDLVHKRRELIKRGIDYEDVETFDEYFGEEKVVERVERNDLFGALIKSAMENEEKDVSGQFSDKEVIGNIVRFRPLSFPFLSTSFPYGC
jgi:hypothetical protein